MLLYIIFRCQSHFQQADQFPTGGIDHFIPTKAYVLPFRVIYGVVGKYGRWKLDS
jgi:hypothetical protein